MSENSFQLLKFAKFIIKLNAIILPAVDISFLPFVITDIATI